MKNYIKNGNITIYFSKGADNKAKLQLERLKSMDDFYTDYDLNCQCFILNRDDWESKYDMVPYGLPFVYMEEDIANVVLPASEDGAVVASTLPMMDYVPQISLDIFESIGISPENAIKQFPNLIGFHELGHVFTEQMGYHNLNHWLNKFMATFFAYGFMKEVYPEYSQLWLGNAYITYLDGSQPEFTTLETFDEIYSDMPVANYDWYQKKFAFLADSIYEKHGMNFLELFKGHMPQEKLTSDQAFFNLKKFTNSFDEFK